MTTWKTNLQMTGKVLFGFTLLVGITLFVWCFIRCPANLSKLYGHTEVNYKYVLYFLSAFALWMLLLACCCCLWHDNAVSLCLNWYQRNHQQKDSSTTEDGIGNKNCKEHRETDTYEGVPNTNVITISYIDERQLESNVYTTVVKA
jgi:hypothetical protein